MKLLSATEAAERLGVTPNRVRALISAGRLPAQKVGRDYVIDPAHLKLVRHRKPGRPKAKKQRNA
jgi:excisionase family DNA binding protein